MRKLLLCSLVALLPLLANARDVWTGSKAVGWDDSFVLSTAELGTVRAGDYFQFTFEVTVPDNQWPQFRIEDLSYNVLGSASLSNGMTQFKIYATQGLVDGIVSGAKIRGTGCTMTKIELIEGDGGDYSRAVWIGECVIGNWSGYQQVANSAFANAKVGQLLRIKFKNLGTGAYLSLRNPANGWPDLTDAIAAYIAGTFHQYAITSGMLAELQTNGLIISGVNFTVTAVELWDAADYKPLTASVPVTGNWVFEGDKKPAFTVQVTNPYNEAVTANVVVDITTDKLAPVSTLTQKVQLAANSSQNVALALATMPKAGIYRATANVNDEAVRSFFFAVNPTEIVSAPDKQNDFDTYWAAAKAQLAQVPINAKLTKIDAKSGTYRNVYLVEMQSIADGLTGDPVIIRGYYCEPVDGKKHPVIIHYQGYDSEYRPGGDSATPWCPNANWDTEETGNYVEFILSNRGQSVNNRPASGRDDGIQEDFTNIYGDWFAYQFGNKDAYYYRGAYMDCLRAIDFVASRETSDMQNLYAEGQSQGGAFTVAAAALSDYKFNAIAPAITFMGDFPDYFQLVSWPAYVAFNSQKAIVDAGGTMSDADLYAFLSYFDTKNLATNISSPYITSVGLQDNVCPAHTNLAPFNNAQTAVADKQVVFNAELQHATNSQWNDTYMAFFKKYADKNPTSISTVASVEDSAVTAVYDLQGRRVSQPTRGLYIMGGKKFVKR
jgi:cephalosporin-C deacetylase